MMTLAEILARCDPPARRNGRGWMAHCPAHRDSSPSLSLAEGPQGALVHCFAGCTTRDVLVAFGGAPRAPSGPAKVPVLAPWRIAAGELGRQALRRHAPFWLPEDARLLLNVEVLIDMLRRQASLLQATAASLPPDLDSTWDMIDRAAELERETRSLTEALG